MKRRWTMEVTLIPKLLSALVRLTLTPQKPAATLAKVLHVQQFLNRSHFWLVTMEMWVMQWLQRVASGRVGALQAAGSEGLKLLLYLGHWDAPAATCRQNFIMQEERWGSNGVVVVGGVYTGRHMAGWYELSGYFSTGLSKKLLLTWTIIWQMEPDIRFKRDLFHTLIGACDYPWNMPFQLWAYKRQR